MGKKVVISQKQYQKALAEGITVNADVSATNGDERKAIETARQQAKNSGVNMDDVTIQVPGRGYNESRIIRKSEIEEARLKRFQANTKLYTVSDFMASLKR